ncbi:MAG TPA: hypothetical protein VJ742_13230 [Nitrososphaera sp.]|nr:hypothetical protein [Nitrososphaera sp.]
MDTEYYPYLVYMFGTHGPLTTYGDLLYLLPLPNIDNAGKFCVPAPQIETVPLEERSVAWGINTAYQMIWDSNFNTDILDSVRSSYASQAPKSIFGNIGAADKNAYAVSPLFASWQELSLDEVVKVSDWMHPNGNYFNVLNAMELLIGTEAQDYTSHTFVNMMYRTAMEIDQEKKSQAAR